MSKRILVVDDEPAIARLVKMCLDVEGYRTRTVASGFEALDAVGESMPDLVVLDIMMPGMSGFDVCAEIRRKPEAKKVKIIFLTARGSAGDAQMGLAAGANDYIVKPFDPDELLDKVKLLIGAGA